MSSSLADQIHQDAAFFDRMVGLVPSSYYAPIEQETDNKFTHSKSATANARQSIKENSKQGLKAKAKFDPKNYTSVLTNGKSNAAASDDDDDDDDDDDEDDDDDDADDSDAMSDVDSAPSKSKKSTAATPSSNSSAIRPPVTKTPVAPSSTTLLLAGAPLSSLLPVPSLSSLSADVGVDQLRQRLHERINGLSNKRKPEDHPFAKKRNKKEKDEKRTKNKDKPSQHKTKKHPRDDADDANESETPSNKKQKSNTSSTPSTSASPSLTGVRAGDLLDSNHFEFGTLKSLSDAPTSTAGDKPGSFSLQGKLKNKKKVSDETLLKNVENFKEKVSSLKASGQLEEATKLEQEKAMSTAMLRAQGIKVKDDARQLKKSLKRDERKKEKSRAEWGERLATQKTTQDAFHAAKIASAAKKGKGDRSSRGSTADDEAASKEKTGRGGKPQGGRAGFEGKAGGKKFLN